MRLPKLAESSRLAVFFNGVFASPFCFLLAFVLRCSLTHAFADLRVVKSGRR
jgi:hypothetical protein